jgi:hypothetical protein
MFVPAPYDLTGIRDRQDRLEGRVATLEATVTQEARLRAQMDEDVSKLHIQRTMLQALIDTQSDHTRDLANIKDRLGTVETELGVVKTEVGAVKSRLGVVEDKLGDVRIGVHAILDLLDTHLAKKPRRLSLPRFGRGHGGIGGS